MHAHESYKVNSGQEKLSIVCLRVGLKNLSLVITICHHLARHPRDLPYNLYQEPEKKTDVLYHFLNVIRYHISCSLTLIVRKLNNSRIYGKKWLIKYILPHTSTRDLSFLCRSDY